MNTDELLEQMRRDELQDQLGEQTHARVNDYARMRGLQPQLVHYYIRRGKIQKKPCQCGQPVIEIAQADEVFKKGNSSDGGE